MEILLSFDGMVSLLTLIVLEIILGIDNIIFISIFTGKLPVHQQKKARNIGIGLALLVRVLLLMVISAIVKMKEPLFSAFGNDFSIRDIILFLGGIFLLVKTTGEIHSSVEDSHEEGVKPKGGTFSRIILQIILIDIVFSFDSILTAIGLVQEIIIMVIAVVVAMIVMMLFAGPVSSFVNRNPTVKMLALSFLLMIGMILVLDAFHVEVPKGYVYFSIAFSFFVEMLNMRMKKKKSKVKDKNGETNIQKQNSYL